MVSRPVGEGLSTACANALAVMSTLVMGTVLTRRSRRYMVRSAGRTAGQRPSSSGGATLTSEVSAMRGPRHSLRPLATAALAVLTSVALVLPAPAQADEDRGKRQLTVMTQNLYLGSTLTPALVAGDPTAFLLAVAGIFGTVQLTNFPARAEAIADEIAFEQPDLIGLQEVSRWVTSGAGAPAGQDFLEILQAALASRGLDYSVAAVSDNANIGPVPLVAPCAGAVGSCLVTLHDRDVILVNASTRSLRWWNPQHGNYVAQQSFSPPLPGAPSVSFNRGWATIDGRFHGERFHFANTHLETEDFPSVQQAQGDEFLAGPARGDGAVIATGDFNSAADGSTTTTYAALTSRFVDAWSTNRHSPGLTCCQSSPLSNPVTQLASRIDLVLGRRGARPTEAHLVGATPFQATAPLWASDHAGVVARVRLR
jgi:endonuclease/exonuclease/phosphatase family metal-dependent hydrolase